MSSHSDTGPALIVALDFPDAASTMALVDQLDPGSCRLKVGKELFTRCGPALVEELREKGFDIFLDLKFHDIPNTVAAAVRSAAELGVWMLTLHSTGGSEMMRAARNALAEHERGPLLIGVTVLTSMAQDDLAEIGLDVEPAVQVERLGRLALAAGMDGIVCSAAEASLLRQVLGDEALLVTPGIRPAGDAVNDQKRVVTPAEAIASGSNYLVIGRPVTGDSSPARKVEEICRQINRH